MNVRTALSKPAIAAIVAGVVTGFAGIMCAPAVHAESGVAREFEVSWDLCGAATHAVERQAGIPAHLLRAISIAESGRWDDLNRMAVAWPWTVTSGSNEWYEDSKQQAIEVVEGLIRRGIRNIDVGCMQINLYFHGDAFESLEDAFDPLTNVTYAATYLIKLRQSTTDWMTAAGNYHSTTLRFHRRYRNRLMDIWNRERKGLNGPVSMQAARTHGPPEPEPRVRTTANGLPEIDYRRTQELNDAFRNRVRLQEAERTAKDAGAGLIAAKSSADGWKTAYVSGTNAGNYALQARINRIRKAAAEKENLNRALRAETGDGAVDRAAELDRWRKMYNRALIGGSASGSPLFDNLRGLAVSRFPP